MKPEKAILELVVVISLIFGLYYYMLNPYPYFTDFQNQLIWFLWVGITLLFVGVFAKSSD